MSVIDKIDKILDEKKMSFKEALDKLKKEKDLSTAMLEPLGIGMDSFLRFAQLPDAQRKKLVDKMIKGFSMYTDKDMMSKSSKERVAMWKKIKNESKELWI
jgi:hypothetical protein